MKTLRYMLILQMHHHIIVFDLHYVDLLCMSANTCCSNSWHVYKKRARELAGALQTHFGDKMVENLFNVTKPRSKSFEITLKPSGGTGKTLLLIRYGRLASLTILGQFSMFILVHLTRYTDLTQSYSQRILLLPSLCTIFSFMSV